MGNRRQHDLGMDTECHEQHSAPLPSFSSRSQNQILGGHIVGSCQRHGWCRGLACAAGGTTQNAVFACSSGVYGEYQGTACDVWCFIGSPKWKSQAVVCIGWIDHGPCDVQPLTCTEHLLGIALGICQRRIGCVCHLARNSRRSRCRQWMGEVDALSMVVPAVIETGTPVTAAVVRSRPATTTV